jgi:hypothetical protein
VALVAGGIGYAGSYLVKPTFTSTTTFLPRSSSKAPQPVL